MGFKGTDVAREASSLVLLDDNFASIVGAIRLGRRIFDNMQKAMSYILAIHIPIIGLALLPAFFPKLPLLLLPLHIVFMELIIDPVCSVAFESEQEERGIMTRPPRALNERFFGGRNMLRSILQGGLLLAMVLVVYFVTITEGHLDGEIRAITFTSLILGNIFLILTNLSRTRSFIAVLTERNYATVIILFVATGLLMAVLFVPQLRALFSFRFPGYSHFGVSLIGAACMLAVFELAKLYRVRRGTSRPKLPASSPQ
jgi:Ca2+-transporting ATPase